VCYRRYYNSPTMCKKHGRMADTIIIYGTDT
jgi:hypothetical protein